MTRSKKIFAAFALLFVVLLLVVVYDISTRTTFPGSKPSPEERVPADSVPADSVKPGGMTGR